MAFNSGLSPIVQSWVLLLLLALLQCSSAQFCSFLNNGCIDPLAQTAVSFDFQPLFTDPIYFYYGFDASSSGKGKGPMTKTGFWLRYQDRHVNKNAINHNLTSEVALRVGNMTATPSGTSNGCDGVWGTRCSNDIKFAIQQTIFLLSSSGQYYDRPLERALEHMMLVPPHLPNCVSFVFDVATIPVQEFAREGTDQNVTVMPSGSGDRPWQVFYLDDMTDHQQASQVAVGIITRGPSYDSAPPMSPDEIQVELVCLQAPQSPPSGSSKDHD
ncbi:uncharacterized protein N7477_000581 [Penicillium maclennaniae]|uniref:uncharacterized protein n=1 Tax=Penicillium maclennaniae TaxID=1343394 RepID=UPI002541270F|nr:uncharacterized protein N7477_000581 [Penicillium maclennaniae]KAJ5684236.1 hypothetical protein N7477_000581 [Penicillium maclennaniae]